MAPRASLELRLGAWGILVKELASEAQLDMVWMRILQMPQAHVQMHKRSALQIMLQGCVYLRHDVRKADCQSGTASIQAEIFPFQSASTYTRPCLLPLLQAVGQTAGQKIAVFAGTKAPRTSNAGTKCKSAETISTCESSA